MHIGLITPGFSANEADWCIPAVLNLVRTLAERHEVEVFTLRYPHRRKTYTVYGAQVHAFGWGQRAGVQRSLLLGTTLTRLLKAHRRRPFDMFHGLWADEPGFLAVAAGTVLRVPTVVSLMGGELARFPDIGYGGQLSRVGRVLVRRALRGARCVTVGSTYLQRLAQRSVEPGRLLRLPLGVDTRLFHPTSPHASPSPPLVSGKVKLLHVASLTGVKDQRTLVHALARVVRHEPHAHLHVVGDGPLQPVLARTADQLGIRPSLTFHGQVSHEQLPAYYRAADVCVLTSRYESQGMVTLEAAACARVTVGTAVGVLPDVVHASCAVPVGDASALAVALLTAIHNSHMVRAMQRDVRDVVTSTYSLERARDLLCATYERLLAGRSSP